MENTIKRLFSFEKRVDKKEYWDTIIILLLMNILWLGMEFSFAELKDILIIEITMLLVSVPLLICAYIIFPLLLLKGRARYLGRNELVPLFLLFFTLVIFMFGFPSLFYVSFISLMFTYGLLKIKT